MIEKFRKTIIEQKSLSFRTLYDLDGLLSEIYAFSWAAVKASEREEVEAKMYLGDRNELTDKNTAKRNWNKSEAEEKLNLLEWLIRSQIGIRGI